MKIEITLEYDKGVEPPAASLVEEFILSMPWSASIKKIRFLNV